MSRRKVIALMLGNAGLRGTDYQGLLRAGVEQRCTEVGIDLWVYSGRSDWHSHGQEVGLVYDLVTPERVDGIIVAATVLECFVDLPQTLATIQERCPVPLCAVGCRLEGIPSITIDNGMGMARVVEHLVRHHGNRRFAFIAGPKGHEESEARIRATREVLVRFGLELPEEAIVYGNFSPEAGAVAMRELLERHRDGIDAVVAANDDMAAGALETIVKHGRRCPEDIAVVGFDDAPSSRVAVPSMTTVSQPTFQVGVAAADSIMAMWRGETCPALLTLPTEAVLRQSCGCDPLRQPGVAIYSSEAPSEPLKPREQIANLLRGVLGDRQQSAAWADRLWRALDDERAGRAGALREVLAALLAAVRQPDAQLFELQRLIVHLRAVRAQELSSLEPHEVYQQALLQISHDMHQREMRRLLHDHFLIEELRISWKRVATSLSFDLLRDNLIHDLPRFSVRNAVVSIYPPDDLENLIPLVCLVDGAPVLLDPVPFPSRKLRPDGIPGAAQRCSMAVMPLAFESEPLGIAMLDLPVKEAYQVLREQMSSAIKTIRLHETLMQQQERLKLQAQIESQATAERLRTMSLIAGGVAHDLNNTLGPLLGLPDAIREDLKQHSGPLREQLLTDLDTLQEAAQRAAHTIRDLLTLGRTLDVPKRLLDANRILEYGQRSLMQLAERTDGVRLRLFPAQQAMLVQASRDHLLRAISNLVANAADAMDGPGEIVVRVLGRKLTQRLAGIEPVEPGDYVVIEVEDSGCGIPSKHLPHVLEPFFTSKQQTMRGGTGLGLSIVHQVVRECGGYVQVQSRLAEGTTFSLYLPRVIDGVAPESLAPAAAGGGNERILVVDDERVQLRTAQRILSKLGYRVETADSGTAALAIFERHLADDPFELVVLDVMMPGALNGPATLERMRHLRPRQKAVFATGYAPKQLARETPDTATPWLAKPYTAAALARAVRDALSECGSYSRSSATFAIKLA